MSFVLDWVLPVCAGALIGYLTNWLAIKMLFRPLKEHRIGSFRIPFTPGLLPKERKRIAQSIGDTVAGELLTAEVVQKRLADPELRAALRSAVAQRLDVAFAADSGKVLAQAVSESGPNPLKELGERAWASLTASRPFAYAVGAAVKAVFSAAEDLPLSALLPPEAAREIAALALAPDRRERAQEKLEAALMRVYGSGGARLEAPQCAEGGHASMWGELAGLLPREALAPLVRALVEGLYTAALPAVDAFLREPATKRSLEHYANEIVSRAVGRLSLFQRLFVGLAQYERTIAETMPDTVNDLVDAASSLLHEPGMASRAAEAAVSALADAADSPPELWLRRLITREAAYRAATTALDALFAHGPEFAQRVAALVAARPELSVAGFFEALGLPAEELAERSSNSAGLLLSGQGSGGRLLAAALPAFAAALAEGLCGVSIGSALGAEPALRERLADWIADRALALVASEAERIIEGLDIARIVVEKIDGLDMIDVERMILAVVDKELKWITVLGGVLGGLIGLVQGGLSLIK